MFSLTQISKRHIIAFDRENKDFLQQNVGKSVMKVDACRVAFRT